MKDTNNLLDHNTWSSEEYNNNPEIFNLAPSTMRIVSNEYSNIGESSIRLTKTAASGAYARITQQKTYLIKLLLHQHIYGQQRRKP